MKAMALANFGGPEVLRMTDLPVPEPGPGEVLIQIAYTSVNPVDCKIRQGVLQDVLPHRFPLVPGWDASGLVTALGPGASLYKAGDKVYAYARKPVVQEGTYAEFITLDEKNVALMPNNIGFKDAAVLPLAALTAWQALFDYAHLKSGETILIHAGAGGVGGFAIQFAKASGAQIYTTASLMNHELVKEFGATKAIDYVREDVAKICQEDLGGVDVVLDLVGGETLRKSFGALKKGGRLVSAVEMPSAELAEQFGVRVSNFLVSPSGEQLKEIARWVEDGRLKIPPLREYDLKDAAAAQSLSETGHVQGKIVLKVK